MKTLLHKRFTWLVVLIALVVNTAMAQNHHMATPVEPGSKGNLPTLPARPAEAEEGHFGGLELDHQTMNGIILNGYYTYEGWLRFPKPTEYEADYYTLQYRQVGTDDWKTWIGSDDQPYHFEGDNACPSLDYMETEFRLKIHGGPKDGYISNVVKVTYPVVGKCRVRSYPLPSDNQLVGRPVRLTYLNVDRHDYPEYNQTKQFTVEDNCYRYSWYRRNPNTGEMTKIEGANTTEYTPTVDDLGYQVVIVVTGDDEHVSFMSTINFQLVQLPLECSVEYMDKTGFTLNSAYVLPNPSKNLLITDLDDWEMKSFADGSLTTLKPGQYTVEMDLEKYNGAELGYTDNRLKVSFVYSQPKYDDEGNPIEGEYEPWYREAQLMYDRYMVPFTVNAMFNNALVSTTFDVIGKNRLGEIGVVATVTPKELEEGVASFEVFQGKYYVRAHKAEGMMDTYFPNVQLWSEAEEIEPEPRSWEEDWKPTSVSIAMQAAPAPMTGIGVIEGTVVLNEPAAGTRGGDSEAETETCRVYLKEKDAEIVAQTETDANGKFRFENVPYGDYQVLLDVEGRAMKSVQEVAVTEEAPEVAELDYVITDTEILTEEEYIASVSDTAPISIGKSGKASYCGSKSLDFSFSEEVKAYIATGFDKDEGTIWLTRVKDVPAGVPVLIKGEADKTYDVPVTDSQNSYYTNMFVGNTSGGTVQITETDGVFVNYYLSGDGTFKSVNKSANIGNNKCYLQLPGTFEPAVTGATQKVTIKASGKASYAAPVDLDFTNVEGLKAFSATGYDKSSKTIWLTRVMKVQKGEGVLLKGDAKDYEIPSAAIQSSYMNMFVGNTSGDKVQVQETSADGSQTNFYLNGDGSFVSVNGFVNIGNNKCYLELPTSMVATAASTRGAEANYILEEPEMIKLPILFRSIGNDGDGTTGIKDQSSKFNAPSDAYYTLQGQRVAKPGKGLYIKNGRKVVIK